MVVVMQERASEAQIEQVVKRLVEMGMDVHRSTGVTRTVLGAVGQGLPDAGLIEMLDGVHEVVRISSPYKLASRTFKPEGTVVTVGDVRIGGDEVIVMAGPCSAENEKQVGTTAAAVRRAGAKILRGGAATIEEWLLSAEYVLSGGNTDVILCERGIRTFETATRNTFDISAIPVVRKLSHLPIVADPSHGAGRRDMVVPMARAAVAAGADGLIIEVHHDPDHALSDGAQSLFPSQFDRLMAELRIIAPAIGRNICLEPVVRRGWS